MFVLKKADYEGIYFGKELVIGDWYGVDSDTNRPLVVKRNEITEETDADRVVPVYVLHNNRWRYYEVPFDLDYKIVYNGYLDRANKDVVDDLPLFVRNLET